MDHVRFLTAGDCAVTVELGSGISEAVNRRIRALSLALEQSPLPGVIETVPTYRSLTVHYDPELISFPALEAALRSLIGGLDRTSLPPGEVLEIPVLYGGEAGPDLSFVAEHAGLTPEEVIARHSAPDYLIYMLGFTPGFPYLGGMDEQLAAPRLKTPRVCIPAGSVGIAGSQTGIYPLDSPGGWQLIGRTPIRMYAPERAVPILPQAGQYIRFRPIDQAEYDRIAALEAVGTESCVRRLRKEAAQ